MLTAQTSCNRHLLAISNLPSSKFRPGRHVPQIPKPKILPTFPAGSAFARAPMILPGMPSGRPCALAKTSARTRKHWVFSRLALQTPKSDNVHFSSRPFAHPKSQAAPGKVLFTKHNSTPTPGKAPPGFIRIHPTSFFGCPTFARSSLNASHNMERAFAAD